MLLGVLLRTVTTNKNTTITITSQLAGVAARRLTRLLHYIITMTSNNHVEHAFLPPAPSRPMNGCVVVAERAMVAAQPEEEV